jgi:TolB protein
VTRLHVTLAIAALVAPGALATALQATPPGQNGRIAFVRLGFQNRPWGELFAMNPDGTGVHQLTHPRNGTVDDFPAWSPDGKRIVFQREPPTGVFSIWTISEDGGGLRRLSRPCPPAGSPPKCSDDSWPAWSPDGKHIAFARISGALRPKGSKINHATAYYRDELIVTDGNGRHPRTLVWRGPWRGDPKAPVWSPDGKRIVFLGTYMNSKTNGSGCECRSLYVVNADGSGLHRILAPGLRPGGRPDWSPGGSTILFRTHPGRDPSGIGANLYTIHPDGSGLHQLTHLPAYARVLDGSYSPDGKAIVFETSDGAVGGQLPDVFVMNADGTNMHPITQTRNFETAADWGPG